METDFGNGLIESLKQVVDRAKGRETAGKVHVVEVPDVRSLRRQPNI